MYRHIITSLALMSLVVMCATAHAAVYPFKVKTPLPTSITTPKAILSVESSPDLNLITLVLNEEKSFPLGTVGVDYDVYVTWPGTSTYEFYTTAHAVVYLFNSFELHIPFNREMLGDNTIDIKLAEKNAAPYNLQNLPVYRFNPCNFETLRDETFCTFSPAYDIAVVGLTDDDVNISINGESIAWMSPSMDLALYVSKPDMDSYEHIGTFPAMIYIDGTFEVNASIPIEYLSREPVFIKATTLASPSQSMLNGLPTIVFKPCERPSLKDRDFCNPFYQDVHQYHIVESADGTYRIEGGLKQRVGAVTFINVNNTMCTRSARLSQSDGNFIVVQPLIEGDSCGEMDAGSVFYFEVGSFKSPQLRFCELAQGLNLPQCMVKPKIPWYYYLIR